MENGVGFDGGGNLTQELSALTIGSSVNGYSNSNGMNKSDGLFQVMKAVEAAEATIKQQVEENHRLRSELQKKIQELENYKSSDSKAERCGPTSYVPETKIGGLSPKATDGQVSRETPNINGFSPLRYQMEGEFDVSGLVPISEVNNAASHLNQVVIDSRDQEQEILLLRKHLVDYSIKEAQIHNEKFALEKRIAYMRLAFDQQQQDLVDAASKALSYRQDIIEENIRLTYALQDAQEERTTFVSSLMPLLAEYSLQPPVADAQSIVSNVKVLFRHLQEKLIGIETKLKESQYQLAAWRSDSSFAQSPLYSFGDKNGVGLGLGLGLELVPQQTYPDGGQIQIPISSDHATPRGWDAPPETSDPDSGRYSPLLNTNLRSQRDTGGNSSYMTTTTSSKNEESSSNNKQVTFSDPPVSTNNVDAFEDPQPQPQPYSPYLSPVPEKPDSSSYSEDDPLPAVESLQISGEAFPGRELQASGYSLNGTTSCNFEWVRHMEDGSVSYIEGAKQPNYLVTADDVDTYLAIEVQPMDNRKRKGELVKVFANEHRKIVCDPEMHDNIRKALQTGHAEHRLSLWAGYLEIWEPVTLVIRKDGINIKGGGTGATPINEKFSPNTRVSIPCGNPVEFSIISLGSERRLRVEQEPDAISLRDIIVLTMRYFINRAAEKKKVKKKGLFF
ncbi:hypothetical protein LXL04_023490 [Taraxacum kok-saghyz]